MDTMDLLFKSITSIRTLGIGILSFFLNFFFYFLSCVSVVNSLLMLLPLMVSAALSYQALTSTDYSAIILNQVLCYLSFKLLVLFFLSLFPKLTITCIYNSFSFQSGFLNDIFDVSRYWKSCKYLQPNCWLESWLRREIQALMQVCCPFMEFSLFVT